MQWAALRVQICTRYSQAWSTVQGFMVCDHQDRYSQFAKDIPLLDIITRPLVQWWTICERSGVHPAILRQSNLVLFYLVVRMNVWGILIPGKDNCRAQLVPCFVRAGPKCCVPLNFLIYTVAPSWWEYSPTLFSGEICPEIGGGGPLHGCRQIWHENYQA